MSKKNNEFPWFSSYPKGVPHEINPDQFNSLIELMEDGFQKFAHKKAFTNMGKSITFAEVDEYSKNFAAYLQNNGMKKGDKIAIQMPNCLQYPIAMFGAIRAGISVINTNPLYTPREMKHQFVDSGVKAIVIVENFASNLEKIISETKIEKVFTTQLGDLLDFPKKQLVNVVVKYVRRMVPSFNLPNSISFNKALNDGEKLSYTKPEVKNDEIAFIQYTGGTTGLSKGAVLSHRNIIANVEANEAWQSVVDLDYINVDILSVAALPMYHIYCLTVNVLTALKTGSNNLLITNPRDLEAFIKDLKANPPSIFTGVNTLYNALLNHPKFTEVDFSNLKITSAGGMALQKVVAKKWFEVTGCLPCEGYGLSETSPVLSSNPIIGDNRVGTIGVPWPSTEMRILNDKDEWAAPEESGEICAFGPQVMVGYYQKPEENQKAFFLDKADNRKWFRTGDIGVMSADGYFKIVDRKKDMILVSGFNVYPNEVEDVIAECPGVLEVACVGVPDEKSTEAVKVYVVKKDPNLTEEQIREYSKENLTGYKRPKYIEFRDELPKTNVGKILRRSLRDEDQNK